MFSVQSGTYGYGWQIEEGSRLDVSLTDKMLGHDGSLSGYKASIAMANHGAFTVISLANNGRSLNSSVTSGVFRILEYLFQIRRLVEGTATGQILARRLPLSLVGGAGHIDDDCRPDLRVQHDFDPVKADRLDRLVQRDLGPSHREAVLI